MMVTQENRPPNNVYYVKCGYTKEIGNGQRYSVFLALEHLEGETFAAGAEIYRLENELFEQRRQLVKVASLYLKDVTGYRKALHAAIRLIVDELEENASVCVKGKQLGTIGRLLYRDKELLDAIHAKNMFFSFRNIKGTMRHDLDELVQDVKERKSNIISNI
ncbi:hypothetical protein [Metabacillus bambusae]|uniref:Uncharacterized protein n=1 Tax=Metabacillus bambusae TaxID=2795218 RepID=A0ABS3N5Y7_9BACI|nr:hypothetical protein [Metabacillus bambusae]MBO1513704.1 hypothetical protein [Metabacillus bambusae]